jgi:hypothetical protein
LDVFYVRYSTLLHLPPLGGCGDRTQDCCDFGDREMRMGNKELRLKIGERGRETRNRDLRLARMGDKEQRRKIGEDGRQGTET